MRSLAIALLASTTLALATVITPTTITAHAQENVCAPPAAGAPIVLEGNSRTTTAPFLLEGNYRLNWTSSAESWYNTSINLVATTDTSAARFGDLLVNTTAASDGSTYAYNVKRGTYYLKVGAHANWTVTLTPV